MKVSMNKFLNILFTLLAGVLLVFCIDDGYAVIVGVVLMIAAIVFIFLDG